VLVEGESGEREFYRTPCTDVDLYGLGYTLPAGSVEVVAGLGDGRLNLLVRSDNGDVVILGPDDQFRPWKSGVRSIVEAPSGEDSRFTCRLP